MEKYIQAHSKNGIELGVFMIVRNACEPDFYQEAIRSYFDIFEESGAEEATSFLFKWGIKRVLIEFNVEI